MKIASTLFPQLLIAVAIIRTNAQPSMESDVRELYENKLLNQTMETAPPTTPALRSTSSSAVPVAHKVLMLLLAAVILATLVVAIVLMCNSYAHTGSCLKRTRDTPVSEPSKT